MSNLTPDQLEEISDYLDKSVDLIDSYQSEHYGSISDSDHDKIDIAELKIMQIANRLRVQAIIISVENSTEFLDGIRNATKKIQDTIQTINEVGKVINLATSVVSLGLSIATSNIGKAKTSLEDIVSILDDN